MPGQSCAACGPSRFAASLMTSSAYLQANTVRWSLPSSAGPIPCRNISMYAMFSRISVKHSNGSSKGNNRLPLDIATHPRFQVALHRQVDLAAQQIRQAVFEAD